LIFPLAFDTDDTINTATTISIMEGMVKALALRIPDDMLLWVRNTAARETIKRGQQVSMNTLILEILRREMEADRKEG